MAGSSEALGQARQFAAQSATASVGGAVGGRLKQAEILRTDTQGQMLWGQINAD